LNNLRRLLMTQGRADEAETGHRQNASTMRSPRSVLWSRRGGG
jgi:hypothetical protein